MQIFETALTFFLVTNPIGNTPTILALTKDYPFQKQRWILFREGVFALLIAIFFQYFGEIFLRIINASDYALTLTGGLLLFLVALFMIFPKNEKSQGSSPKQEPFIVPIATPLTAGPGLMTIIMINSKLAQNNLLITGSLVLSFAGVIGIMVVAPYLQKILGRRGLLALEQIMGMVLSLIAMEMVVKGSHLFVNTLKTAS
jgi:multiple antibiotic resistance protein